jgi:hypothetical protein
MPKILVLIVNFQLDHKVFYKPSHIGISAKQLDIAIITFKSVLQIGSTSSQL